MIRIATIHHNCSSDHGRRLAQMARDTREHSPDILCFQNTASTPHVDHYDVIKTFASSVTMSYAFTQVAADSHSGETTNNGPVGLSILTGAGNWMLNSGSLSVADNDNNIRLAQFGVIRKDGDSVLVINAHFRGSLAARKTQLLYLLRLPLLRQQFGAIALCANLDNDLCSELIRASAGLLKLQRHTAQEAAGGCNIPVILTQKEHSPTTIKISTEQPLFALGKTAGLSDSFCDGAMTDFAMQRIDQSRRRRRYAPLSFRERWLGSRDGDRLFALS